MGDDDMLTLGDAAEQFDIPRIKLWRWIKSGKLTAHRSERDLREKLVRRADVAAILAPRPIRSEEGQDAKSAA